MLGKSTATFALILLIQIIDQLIGFKTSSSVWKYFFLCYCQAENKTDQLDYSHLMIIFQSSILYNNIDLF